VSEHEPVHVTWQVEPSVQVTLPLSPTVGLHVDMPAQSTLHDLPHVPWHVLWSLQASEQLSWVPQALAVMSHVMPDEHVQLAPVQLGGGASGSPEPELE